MKSHLSAVQAKYADMAMEMEARSRRSSAAVGSNYQGSLAAKSQVAPSQGVGSRASALLNRDRLKDFNDVTGTPNDIYGLA